MYFKWVGQQIDQQVEGQIDLCVERLLNLLSVEELVETESDNQLEDRVFNQVSLCVGGITAAVSGNGSCVWAGVANYVCYFRTRYGGRMVRQVEYLDQSIVYNNPNNKEQSFSCVFPSRYSDYCALDNDDGALGAECEDDFLRRGILVQEAIKARSSQQQVIT